MEEAEGALRDYQQQLERAFTETREAADLPAQPGTVRRPETEERPPNHTAGRTAVPLDVVKQVIETQLNLPGGFTVHPRLQPPLAPRAALVTRASVHRASGALLAFRSL